MITVEEACIKTAYGLRNEMRKHKEQLQQKDEQIVEQKVITVEEACIKTANGLRDEMRKHKEA